MIPVCLIHDHCGNLNRDQCTYYFEQQCSEKCDRSYDANTVSTMYRQHVFDTNAHIVTVNIIEMDDIAKPQP